MDIQRCHHCNQPTGQFAVHDIDTGNWFCGLYCQDLSKEGKEQPKDYSEGGEDFQEDI